MVIAWELAASLKTAIVSQNAIGQFDMQHIFIVLTADDVFPDEHADLGRKSSDQSGLKLVMRVLSTRKTARSRGR